MSKVCRLKRYRLVRTITITEVAYVEAEGYAGAANMLREMNRTADAWREIGRDVSGKVFLDIEPGSQVVSTNPVDATLS